MTNKNTTPLIPVVLSGGSGSRLWPLSREHYPKQFLPLVGDNTLLQDTVSRVAGFAGVAEPIIVCNEAHRFLVAEQMQNIGQPTQSIILEPVGKNTAPAVAVAALQALKQNDNPVLMVLPADHIIRDVEALEAAVSEGYELAGKGKLITFGIVPSSPETGYGYIETGKEISASNAFEVKQFVEKPDQQTALNYVSGGNYLWNSGMFMFQARQYLQELELYEPDMFAACQKALNDAVHDLDFTRLNKQAFEASPANSIDYAVFEKTLNAAVIPLAAGWSDVGSWSSLWEACDKDEHGNVNTGETLPLDTQGSYLYSSGRLIATMGIKDSIVVETADAVLVADK
ncbi:MAG: mannose-1-phosphate guanylyltransferase/mannose-6-phosphate isomerase, partial [Proteobacteria bacterium]|nr:mannose-1-phosphate guanylyltransferase/mannose-6-phosphate isomerase [Pseudomonadota bacterium]